MKKILFPLIPVIALLAACTAPMPEEETIPEVPVESEVAQTEPQTVAMEVYLSEDLCRLVERDLADGGLTTKSAGVNAMLSSLNAVSMTRLFPDAGEFEPRTRAEGLHRWYKVVFAEKQPVTRASADIMSVEGIELASPAREYKLRDFNDPEFKRQWHYYNNGSQGSSFKAGCDVNCKPVWENFTTGDPKVIVAVVDAGVQGDHPDLAANYVGGYNSYHNNNAVVPGAHGTHVAGTIAAVNNNGIGVCGIAGGDAAAGQKGVGILSCQMLGEQGSANTSAAIKWGADHGAVISQNSWGFDFKTEDDIRSAADQGLSSYAPSLKAAIDYFIKYAGCDNSGNQLANSPMKGGVFIMSSGNDNIDRDVVCEYDPVLTVSSVGPNFDRASYSNYGPWVDICAPGGESQYGTNAKIYSTTINNGYTYMEGTSMACPHVSGVAALVVSYYGGKGFTNTMLLEKLIKGANAEVMAKVNERGNIGPLVDAFGAMTYGGAIPPANVTGYTVTQLSNNLDFTWTVTKGKDGVKAYGYLLMAAKDASLLQNIDPSAALPEGVISKKVFTESIKAGSAMTARISDLEFNTTYYTAIAGFNSNNYYSDVTGSTGAKTSVTPPTSIKTTGNNAPKIYITGAESITLKAHETGALYFRVADPDEHDVIVEFDGGSKAASAKSEDGTNYTVNINAPLADSGTYTAAIKASDKYGLSTSGSLTYTILENHAPEKIKDVDNILMSRVGESATLTMTDYITDPDGEVLKYSANLSTTTNLNLVQENNTITLRATNFGETTVTMTGADVKGKLCRLSFKVLARDPSVPIDVYPNPVVDMLTIRPYKATSSATVTVYSSTGAKVMQQTGGSSPFDPFKLDMKGVAPGRYVVSVSFEGETHQRTIIKQ